MLINLSLLPQGEAAAVKVNLDLKLPLPNEGRRQQLICTILRISLLNVYENTGPDVVKDDNN